MSRPRDQQKRVNLGNMGSQRKPTSVGSGEAVNGNDLALHVYCCLAANFPGGFAQKVMFLFKALLLLAFLKGIMFISRVFKGYFIFF